MMSVTCFKNYLMAAGEWVEGGRWGQEKNRIIYELIIVETRPDRSMGVHFVISPFEYV